jgi:hypothetical protein
METNKISFTLKLLDKNIKCHEHKSSIIAICAQKTCNNRPICVNCLVRNHFADHDQKNIIPLKDYLEKLDDYFYSIGQPENNNILLEAKTSFLDVLENFKQETNELVESVKNNIRDYFSYFEEPNSDPNTAENIYSQIEFNQDPISSLIEKISQIGVHYEVKNQLFKNNKNQSENLNTLNNLKLTEFISRIEGLSMTLKKKLILPDRLYFKSFNLTDEKIIKITYTDEGINFRKVDHQHANTFLVISNEHLDFSQIIVWRFKILNLPSRWLGLGILPRSKFKREGWNSTDLIGLNCDKYFLDRGNNQQGNQWEVCSQSVLTFTFNGPEQTLKIENTLPKFEVVAKNLDNQFEYCMALFFHYNNSEIILLK